MPHALVLAASLLAGGCGGPSSTPGTGDSRAGQLRAVKPTVELIRGERSQPVAGTESVDLVVGDRVRTSLEGEAVLVSGPQVQVIGPDSELTVTGADGATGRVDRVSLIKGLVTFLFPPAPDKQTRFEAVAHTVVAAVKGTIFRMEASGDEVTISVVRGEVEVRRLDDAGAVPVAVPAGSAARLAGGEVRVESMAEGAADRIRTDLMLRRVELGIDISTF